MIYLFYYKNNLGDILSYYIIKKISGEDIRFTNPLSIKIVMHDLLSFGKLLIKRQWKTAASRITFSFKPVIIGVGSLLEHSTSNCITWGTGMAQKHMIPSGGRFLITRGYLSKQVLENVGFKVESEICGDPALLMPLLYKPNIEIMTDKIGVIPHIS